MSRPRYLVPYPIHHLELALQDGRTVTLEEYVMDGLIGALAPRLTKVAGKRRAASREMQLGLRLFAGMVANRMLWMAENDYLVPLEDPLEKASGAADALFEHGREMLRRIEVSSHE